MLYRGGFTYNCTIPFHLSVRFVAGWGTNARFSRSCNFGNLGFTCSPLVVCFFHTAADNLKLNTLIIALAIFPSSVQHVGKQPPHAGHNRPLCLLALTDNHQSSQPTNLCSQLPLTTKTQLPNTSKPTPRCFPVTTPRRLTFSSGTPIYALPPLHTATAFRLPHPPQNLNFRVRPRRVPSRYRTLSAAHWISTSSFLRR